MDVRYEAKLGVRVNVYPLPISPQGFMLGAVPTEAGCSAPGWWRWCGERSG